jgi:rhomboid protease GluP
MQAEHCPHCGTSHPGAWWKNNLLTRGMQDPHLMLRVLIGVKIAMYVVSLLLHLGGLQNSLANPLTFLSPDNRSLLLLGATGTIPIDNLHRWWTLVSASYLHGGILHLVFNMIALRQIFPLIASEYGPSRMFVIYTTTGIIGFGVSYLAGIPFTIGASASLCGLIGAALYFGKSRGGSYGTAVYRQIGGWAITIFLFGFLIPGINNWGHGGGMAAGVLCGYWLGYQERVREQLWHHLLASASVVFTVGVLAWAVVMSLLYKLSM